MRPNLFILGAPKCGTSTLFAWLAHHPGIRGTRIKEPFCLIDPAHPLARRGNLGTAGISCYADLFAPDDAGAPIRMEGTTHYLYDTTALQSISHMEDAQVIIVLREPAARIYSSFQYTVNNLGRLNPSLTFAQYLELIESGAPLYPDWCSHPGSAFVLENDITYSRYRIHVAPWLEALGKQRVKVLLMEDMVRSPQGTIDDLLAWLGLDRTLATPDLERARNKTNAVRLPQVQAVARRINSRIRPPESIRVILKRAYGALQYRKPQAINPEDLYALHQLRQSFTKDNTLLSELTGLDLTPWRQLDMPRANQK